MHPMLTIACRAAEEAGHIIQRGYRDLDKIHVHEKGRGDLVSAVDQQAEQSIVRIIHDKYPNHHILAEEFGEHDTSTDKSDYQWVIDPLDGTANFVHGLPHFAVSIALIKKGIPEIGVVYNPITDDWFIAARGNGARLNRQRIRVNNQTHVNRAFVATGFPYKYPEYMAQQITYVDTVLQTFSDIRRLGAASLDLCYVACGRIDAYFELGLMPWDMAAGILIAQEAGAIVTDFDGDKHMLNTGTLICANPTFHPVLKKLLDQAKSSD